MEEHTVVSVDVAKDVFELAVSEEPGRVRLSRGELAEDTFAVRILFRRPLDQRQRRQGRKR